MALKVGELYASFGIDSKGISKDISGIEKQCSSIGKSLAITGAALTASVTRPIVNTAKDIVKTGASFDGQMSRVKAIAQATDAEFETLRNTALEWAGKTKFTAQETGEAMEYMGMAGWKAKEMVEGLPAILALAAASGEDLGTTSDIVTDGLTAFGLKAEDASRFADVLAAASVNANTNVSMMGESFKYIAPLAGSMGYSIEDTAVALGLMANSGIKASMAGTSLRNIIQNMQKPTKDQAEAMKKLGLSLTDAKGGTKSLMKVMKEMRQSAKKAGIDTVKLHDEIKKYDEMLNKGTISEEEYDAKLSEMTKGAGDFMTAISELAGARGLSGMLAIMNSSDEDFDKFVAAIRDSDGEAQRLMGEMLDNLEGDMIIFDSALNTLKIRLYDLFSDDLRNVVQEATKYVDAFSNMDSETQKLVVELGALAAAAGPAVAAIGGLIAGLPKVAPALKAIISPAGIAAGSLALFAIAAVDADNKVGQAFDDFATKAAASLESSQADIESYISTVSGRIPALADSITSGIGKLVPALVKTAGTIITSFIGVISKNAEKVSNIGFTFVSTLIDSIATEIEKQDMVAEASTMLTNLGAAIIKGTPDVVNSVVRLATSLLNGYSEIDFEGNAQTLANAFEEAVGKIDMKGFEGLAKALINAMVKGIEGVGTGTAEIIGKLGEVLGGIKWDEVAVDVSGFANMLVDGLIRGLDALDQVSSELIAAIGNMIGSIDWAEAVEAAKTIAAALIRGLILGLGKMTEVSVNLATNLAQAITKIDWGMVKDGAIDIADTLISGLSSGLAQIDPPDMGPLADAVSRGLESIHNDLDGPLVGLAGSMLDAISNGLNTENFTGAEGLAKNIIQKIASVDFSGMSVTTTAIASKLISAIATAIKTGMTFGTIIIESIGTILSGDFGSSLVTAAGNIASSLVTSIAREIPGIADKGIEIVQALGGVLKDAPWSEAGTQIGQFATNLVKSIGTIITGDAENGVDGLDVSGIIDAIGQGLESAAAGIGSFVGSVVGEIAKFLTDGDAIAQMMDAGAKLGWGVIKGMMNFAYHGIEGAGQLISNVIVEGFRAFAGVDVDEAIEAAQIKFGELVFDALGNVVESGSEEAVSDGVTLVQAMAAGLTNTEALQKAIDAWGVVTKNGFEQYFPEYEFLGNDAAIAVFSSMIMGLNRGEDGVEDAARAAATLVGTGYGENLVSAMDQYYPEVYQAMTRLLSADNGAYIGTEQLGFDIGKTMGLELPEGFEIGFKDGMAGVAQIVDGEMVNFFAGWDSLENGYDAAQMIRENWAAAFAGLSTDLVAYSDDIGAALSQIGLNALDLMEIPFTEEFINKLAADLASGEITTEEAVNRITQTMMGVDVATPATAAVSEGVTAANTEASNATSVGEQFDAGVATGISNNESVITRSARSAALSAYKEAMRALVIRSPSHLAEKGIGKMFDAGIAVGIDKNLGMLEDAASRVSDVLMGQQYVAEPSRNTVYTARQSALETEQAIVRAASSKAFRSNANGGDQRMMHVILELDGETVAETIVPIVDDTMMADMKTSNRR